MAKIYDVVARQEYEKNGETKVKWINCGAMFENAEGRKSMKIDSLPVEFNGWLNLFEPKPKGESKPADAPVSDFDQDEPF